MEWECCLNIFILNYNYMAFKILSHFTISGDFLMAFFQINGIF